MLYYLADALEPAERKDLLQHLATGCPVCSAYLAEAEAVFEKLAWAVEPMKPNKDLRKKLLSRIAASEPVGAVPLATTGKSTKSGWRIFPILAAAACAVLAAGGMYYFAPQLPNVKTKMDEIQLTASRQQTRVRELEAMADTQRKTDEVLQSTLLEVALIKGAESQPQASARLFFSRDVKICKLYAAGLKPLDDDKTYVLWFITKEDIKVPMGSFSVDETGHATLVTDIPDEAAEASAAAVTDEPASGSAQPTGTIQMVGTFESR